MQPVNLSRLEFTEKEEAESYYASARESTPYKKMAAPPVNTTEHTPKEISSFCSLAVSIISDMMRNSADIQVTDIAHIHSEGKQYELLPNLHCISNSYRLPQLIQKEV